ncbi:MAG TPA: hypothetical protein VFC19_28605 [Candidatus Limnocylindrales bacterium]|nr:hypothetical protein [Candidatus Limnocylindrales bacterium]
MTSARARTGGTERIWPEALAARRAALAFLSAALEPAVVGGDPPDPFSLAALATMRRSYNETELAGAARVDPIR